MGRYFILRGDQVVEEPDYPTWSKWYCDHYRSVEIVARTQLGHGTVSTRFLAIEMTLRPDSEPLLFETRIAGGWLHDQWERAATMAEARAAHDRWVERGRRAEEDTLPPPGAGW